MQTEEAASCIGSRDNYFTSSETFLTIVKKKTFPQFNARINIITLRSNADSGAYNKEYIILPNKTIINAMRI